MRVVYEDLGDGPLSLRTSMRRVIAEQHYLYQRDQDHADRWWPAGVFLLVRAV